MGIGRRVSSSDKITGSGKGDILLCKVTVSGRQCRQKQCVLFSSRAPPQYTLAVQNSISGSVRTTSSCDGLCAILQALASKIFVPRLHAVPCFSERSAWFASAQRSSSFVRKQTQVIQVNENRRVCSRLACLKRSLFPGLQRRRRYFTLTTSGRTIIDGLFLLASQFINTSTNGLAT